MTDAEAIAAFEKKFRKLPAGYRRKLFAILERPDLERRNSGLTILALKAFPSGPLQKLIQDLRSRPGGTRERKGNK